MATNDLKVTANFRNEFTNNNGILDHQHRIRLDSCSKAPILYYGRCRWTLGRERPSTRFSALLSIPPRLASFVKHDYQTSVFAVFVINILVWIPFLLNFSERIHRNTKTVALPR
jgi:hypothetical protein